MTAALFTRALALLVLTNTRFCVKIYKLIIEMTQKGDFVMAFDACMMRACLTEYRSEFKNAKIEKVLQPRSDEVDLVIHDGGVSRRLVFNVGPNAPRMQLSDAVKENPITAPMFCMFLRKHLTGARITGVAQPGFDRIADFTVSGFDEMGDKADRHIICEIMGKYANLIITDENYKVMNALKIIDFAASTVRQVLPGLSYQIPAQAEKLSPLVIDKDLFFEKLSAFPPERTAEKFITSTYSGIATQIARELVYRTAGAIDVPICNIDKDKFYSVFSSWQTLLITEDYTPTVIIDEGGKPIDYSYMDITYLGTGLEKRHFPTLRELFDLYFAERDRIERINQRARDLIILLQNATARTERKLAIQRQSLLDSEKGEEYKKYGDLITANLYRLERGMESFSAIDYYDESCPEIVVKLDTRLSPAANAQRMYKQYNKCKTAKTVLTEQIKIWERELSYLESVKAFLDEAASEEDLREIRDELWRAGYSAKLKGYKPAKNLKLRPIRYKTSTGRVVLVGRNNIQNDELTMRTASKEDIWFHVKDFPGSHVILDGSGSEPADSDYTEAAAIAALHSKANSDTVAVDYTKVKNIKKPQGSKPGFVTYKTNYTAYVHPSIAKKLHREDK